jgi:hypothetical protein
MNTSIHLHDAVITALLPKGEWVEMHLTAVVHQSPGRPGIDAGFAWRQDAKLSFSGANPVTLASLPSVWLLDGSFRAGESVCHGLIPVLQGYSAPIELRMKFSSEEGEDAGSVVIVAHDLRVELLGEISCGGEFEGFGYPDDEAV